MLPDQFLHDILNPGIAWCKSVPGWNVPFDDRARVLLTAIPGQESNWLDRLQKGHGPAHSLYQFERLGGIQGVLTHPATVVLAKKACAALGVLADSIHVWGIMTTPIGDSLSVAFTRLLLWSDARPLPQVGDEEASWDYYFDNWRPGKPSRERWKIIYPQAVAAIKSEQKA